MCPPSNGITVDYFLDAKTASYGPNFTTQSPECADQENVIKVDASSPYCGGGNVSGPGSELPSLVACHLMPGNSFEENLVVLHDGSNMAVLEDRIMVKDIPAKYPGRRWMYVMDRNCSALPDFSQYGQAPAPAPAPTPTPAPTPSPEPVEPVQGPAPEPSPAPTPVEPIPGQRVAIVVMPPPASTPSPCDAGSWLRQYKMGGRVPVRRLRRGMF
jgi:hypothetical protein